MSLQQLLDERDITRQLTRFARAMDSRDWDTLAAICMPDAVAEFGTGEVQGAAAIIELIHSYLDHCGTTQHLLGNVLVEVDGDRARSEAYVADIHLARSAESEAYFRTLGNYHDQWLRHQGEWRLVERRTDNRALMGTMDVFKPA